MLLPKWRRKTWKTTKDWCMMMVLVFDEERTFTVVLRDIFNDSTLCQSLCQTFQRWHHGLHAEQMRRHSVDSNCLGWQNVWRQWPLSCWQLCHVRTCHGSVDSHHSMPASLAQHIQHYVVPSLHCYNSYFSRSNNTHGFGVDGQTTPVSQWINLLKLSINWRPRCLPELVDGLHDIVQLQTKDLWRVCLVYSHGNYMFTPEFYSLHRTACCLADEEWEEGWNNPQVPGLHSEDKMYNSDVIQWCADCDIKAEHCHEARTTNTTTCQTCKMWQYPIPSQLVQGHHFFQRKTINT